MSKKKNKYHELIDDMDLEKKCKEIADSLESYLNSCNEYLIIEGDPVEIKKAKKTIKKVIKKLRKGKYDEIFDPDEFERYYGIVI